MRIEYMRRRATCDVGRAAPATQTWWRGASEQRRGGVHGADTRTYSTPLAANRTSSLLSLAPWHATSVSSPHAPVPYAISTAQSISAWVRHDARMCILPYTAQVCPRALPSRPKRARCEKRLLTHAIGCSTRCMRSPPVYTATSMSGPYGFWRSHVLRVTFEPGCSPTRRTSTAFTLAAPPVKG